jgi:hypothetical protein
VIASVVGVDLAGSFQLPLSHEITAPGECPRRPSSSRAIIASVSSLAFIVLSSGKQAGEARRVEPQTSQACAKSLECRQRKAREAFGRPAGQA